MEHQASFVRGRRVARRLRGPSEPTASLVFTPAITVNSACMTRRSAFVEAGGYDAEIPICEDADLWARIAHTRGYIFIDRSVVRYRTGARSMMHDLAEGDEKLQVSYRRIQKKFREAHGTWNALR